MELEPIEGDSIASIASASVGSILSIGSIRGRYALLAGLVTIGVAVKLSRA
jgi:hypothetical protein